MSRLIDADAFAEKIKEISIRQGYYDFHPKSMSVGEILDSVIADLKGEGVCGFENAPTVDAVPVNHGHWEKVDTRGYLSPGGTPTVRCSICKDRRTEHLCGVEYPEWRNFCPVCGAKMDEVTK